MISKRTLKNAHKKGKTRVVKVEEPEDPRGLYIVYYQQYRGSIPDGEPYKAYMTKLSYELLTMRWILMSEFKVPEHFIDKVLDKAREVAEDSFAENYFG